MNLLFSTRLLWGNLLTCFPAMVVGKTPGLWPSVCTTMLHVDGWKSPASWYSLLALFGRKKACD
jgi:hypothetical protein